MAIANPTIFRMNMVTGICLFLLFLFLIERIGGSTRDPKRACTDERVY